MNTLKLLSPCHGAPIYVSLDGNDNLTIWCEERNCLNSWDQKGNPE